MSFRVFSWIVIFFNVVLILFHFTNQISKLATTGVWSDGLSQVRGSLSIHDPSQTFASGAETQMWSIRKPLLRRNPFCL